MHELLAVATITILAVISPGPDFAMVTRNGYSFGRRIGLISALGIAAGVQVHVVYTVLGVAILITQSPTLFWVMKVAGAAYLMYLGYQSFRNRTPLNTDGEPGKVPSAWQAFGMGFLTNALNPKTMLFVVATFTQLVQPDAPFWLNFAYGFFMSFAHWVWFSIVAIVFSNRRLRAAMLARQRLLDRGIGVALLGLGASLLFTNSVS
ncbi:LysE family translocator [Providencia rettgeri]|uniref:LysE family translocator n=1 Tax=Alcaligenes sp. SORT26 TaxID=2813780 RepID=UPI001A9E7CB9|nr:LysE family translocator [Alcaligenes sp. SORT26]MBY6347085.1 LysE family translocator [Providencia rettgeri]QTB98368.1 LysE family translocator [Alcaligenes sp. SORT26]